MSKIESKIEIYDSDLPDFIDYFENLFGKSWIKNILKHSKYSINPNFWQKYITSYKKWQSGGAKVFEVTNNERLIEFLHFVKSIMYFEIDWNTIDNRRNFLERMRNSNSAFSLLYELRIGIHFAINKLDVHWIGTSIANADLEIKIDPSSKIYVECTCRQQTNEIIENVEDLFDCLIRSAEKKLKSHIDWGHPRMVAIMIPEYIDWLNNSELQRAIDSKFQHWFKKNRLTSVNGITFNGKESPQYTISKQDGRKMYSTDIKTYYIKNPSAKYAIADNINLGLTV